MVKKKKKVKKRKIIIPKREKCSCGSKVKNHHWLCDKCWGYKEKMKSRLRIRKRTGGTTLI